MTRSHGARKFRPGKEIAATTVSLYAVASTIQAATSNAAPAAAVRSCLANATPPTKSRRSSPSGVIPERWPSRGCYPSEDEDLFRLNVHLKQVPGWVRKERGVVAGVIRHCFRTAYTDCPRGAGYLRHRSTS